MAEGEVADRAEAGRLQVEHRAQVVVGPLGLVEPGALAREPCVEQYLQRPVQLGAVQLVVDLEGLDAGDQRMVRLGDLDAVRAYRWMGDELAAEYLRHDRERAGRPERLSRPEGRRRVERRVGGVQREPPPTALDERLEPALLPALGRTSHVYVTSRSAASSAPPGSAQAKSSNTRAFTRSKLAELGQELRAARSRSRGTCRRR